MAKELIDGGNVTVNGRHCDKGAMVAPGDDVRVGELPSAPTLTPNPLLQIDELYKDDDILIVNKPGSIPCHPLKPGELNTMINAVVAAHPEVAEVGDKPLEGGLIHRLDNGTSGALIIGRTPRAFATMRGAIRGGKVSRLYLALCAGLIDGEVEIATPIAHHPKNRRKMVTQPFDSATLARVRPAATLVRALRPYIGYSLIEARPRTGCRHQLRVHLASNGHPLAGDTLYGGAEMVELEGGRFWLHLSEIAFESPSNGFITIRAPLPAELEAVLARLSQN